MKITDAHVHYAPQTGGEYLSGFLKETGTDSAVIQAVSHSGCISLIPGALVMKDREPGRFYVFGSPDLSGYYLHRGEVGSCFAEYTKHIMAAGCDGVKMLEGKPQMRKAHPIPDFDAPEWEAFWAYAEENAVPIMWHVNDPETHWDPNPSPWLVKQGWSYDETFINNEVQYAQVLRVLERHPALKICFAHAFFMSAQLDRLDGILEKYPNVIIDLTPGIEMYENFSKNIEQTKAFFEKYHDRIAYGTDIGGRCILTNEGAAFNRKENLRRGEIVKSFLTMKDSQTIEADGDFIHDRAPFEMKGLGLEGERLEEILSGNMRAFIGGEPAETDAEEALWLCAHLREQMIELSNAKADFCPDVSEIELAEKYFCEKYYREEMIMI